MWRADLAVLGYVGRVIGAWLRASGGAALALLTLYAAEVSANPEAPNDELFTGFEASDNYASGYLGGGRAFGKGLYEPGWRLRAVASYGRYHYDGTLYLGGGYVPIRFEGEDYFGSALVGYQFHPGPLIVKLFAGLESDSQVIHPHDPNNSVQGSRLGLRLQAEGWYDISPAVYLSADASYGTAFQAYCTLVRLGYRLRPRLSLGLEGGALATWNTTPAAAAGSCA